MSMDSTTMSVAHLIHRVGVPGAPILFDTRREKVFAAADRLVAGAKWRSHGAIDAWAAEIPPGAEVVVYCIHGHQMSQGTAARLRAKGIGARYLAGGIEAYIEAGGVTIAKADRLPATYDGASRWVTRRRATAASFACPWFIRRFLDPGAEILSVDEDWVTATATDFDATPFDVSGADFAGDGETGPYEVFLDRFGVAGAAARRLARIVDDADGERPDVGPQAAGLRAVTEGIAAAATDENAALAQGMAVFDGLYSWCRDGAAETRPQPVRAAGR